ncbi:hypothetical protein [Sorangium cellulosum]|uniref:Pyrrolo-quinoline quinone n=1 Tax=Sorangium cellulosum So0157-2 TaxID=1254432 RepID=S4Y9B6_SORCE|nr:hypothetical protein [Sorangium cellulosum]AGP42107.1 hypothetical protein SCE1572_50960 [Sorangium cellulosum So0157-2]
MSEYRTIAAAPVLVAAFRDQIFGVDPGTGRVLWEYKQAGGGFSSTALLITPAAIYAASFSRVACTAAPSRRNSGSGGFCPPCLGRRMCATAANLIEDVLHEVAF